MEFQESGRFIEFNKWLKWMSKGNQRKAKMMCQCGNKEEKGEHEAVATNQLANFGIFACLC
jgi:hypothetical protein